MSNEMIDVPTVSGEGIPVVNPTTENVLTHVPEGTAQDVDRAVRSAKAAGEGEWRHATLAERAGLLHRFAQVAREHKDELAALDVLDAGLPVRSAKRDVLSACSEIDYFAGLIVEMKGTVYPSEPDMLAYSRRVPYGVVGRIVPFNHPAMFAIAKVGAPLAAGNTVVLKPSEHTSLAALRTAELARGVFPDGVLNVVTGRGDVVGAALASHPDVPRVAFTGGIAAGREVIVAGAEDIKNVTLELGGKNALIVFPDVDPAVAARTTITAMSLRATMGQSCQSSSRVFVHEDVHDDYLERLVDGVLDLSIGDPADPGTDMGPLAYEGHHRRVLSLIDVARREGATVVCGGGRPAGSPRGYFVEPTVLTDVDPRSTMGQQEVFGPVVSIMRWSDPAVMFEAVNDVPYGLTGRVLTNDLSDALHAAHSVRAGTVWVNGPGGRPAGLPFGGFGRSGVGKETCVEDLLSYTQEQALVVWRNDV